MIIEGFIWLPDIIDKLEDKHAVRISEVESVFTENPVFNRVQKRSCQG